MRRRLRRILVVIVTLIVLAVVVPMAYIEGNCRPAPTAVASASSTIALPPITETGYLRKQANTLFTFPEWYIVYSFEDFGRFLDHGSESGFDYPAHIAASGAASAPSTARCRTPANPCSTSSR